MMKGVLLSQPVRRTVRLCRKRRPLAITCQRPLQVRVVWLA
jgi:hypothetical protein